MHFLNKADASVLSTDLLIWWDSNGRGGIPWKQLNSGVSPSPLQELDPYGIWIAEVMLQQTQLSVVLPFWRRWMLAFPTLDLLASASLDEVLLQWQGLGYYSRARRLHLSSQLLVGRPWPRTLEGWMALPGIGRTTAGSILSSAFNMALPILDGNVKRLLARLTSHPRPPARDELLFWSWSEALLDTVRPRDTNQALMDLGSTLCTPRQPGCNRCPWQARCSAYASGDPCRWPVSDAPKRLPFQVIGVGVVVNAAREVLIDQRLEEGLLGGMWEFPVVSSVRVKLLKTVLHVVDEELGITVTVGDELITIDHAYSHKLRFVVHFCELVSGEPQPLASQQVRWVRPDQLKISPSLLPILGSSRRFLAVLTALLTRAQLLMRSYGGWFRCHLSW